MKLRLATAEDKAFLYALWQEAFGDDEKTISLFFDRCYSPQNTLIAEQAETPVAALYLLDTELSSGESTYALSYVYAAATKKEARKNGAMTALLSFAKTLAEERGKDALYLVPASEALFHYYGKRGYQNAFLKETAVFTRAELEALATEAPCECPSTVEQYAKSEKAALEGCAYIRYPASILDLSLTFCEAFGTKIALYQNGYMHYDLEENRAEVTEFCVPAGQVKAFLGALLQIPAELYTLHAPKGVLETLGDVPITSTPVGMLLPLGERIKKENTGDAYLGITLG